MSGEFSADPFHAVENVEPDRFVRILYIAGGLQDIFRDVRDEPVRVAAQRRADRAAAGVAATRITKRSPMEAEKICSGITRESEQQITMAYGCCPFRAVSCIRVWSAVNT